MEYIALASFVVLVLGWLVAPGSPVQERSEGAAIALDLASARAAD